VTLIHVLLRQAGQVIHRSKDRPGTQTATGNNSATKVISLTRLIDPHDEQPTVRTPRGGSGSVAVTVEVEATDSPAGVASE
jgi:hypothetical protein